jgi:hypothetical protein
MKEEICSLLGSYAVQIDNLLTEVSGPPIGPIFKSQARALKMVPDRLNRNVGKKLQIYAA